MNNDKETRATTVTAIDAIRERIKRASTEELMSAAVQCDSVLMQLAEVVVKLSSAEREDRGTFGIGFFIFGAGDDSRFHIDFGLAGDAVSCGAALHVLFTSLSPHLEAAAAATDAQVAAAAAAVKH